MRQEHGNANVMAEIIRDLFPYDRGRTLSSDMPLHEFIGILVEHRQSEAFFNHLRRLESEMDEEPLMAPPEFEAIYRQVSNSRF